MPVTWPSGTTVPQKPQREGFTEEPGDTSIETNMEVGPPKKRNRSTFPIDILRCRFLVTAAQRAALNTFYKTTTASGTIQFEWVHPIDGGTFNWLMSKPIYSPAGICYYADIIFKKVS